MPITGTSARKIKERIKKGITNLFNNEVLITEIIIIISNAKIVKLKCFVKKK